MGGEIKGPLELQREIDRLLGGLKFESVSPPSPPFRPNTELPITKHNMVFRGAGMGDYICYMPAMVWIAKNLKHVAGRIFVGEFFHEFAKNIMEQTGNTNWKVLDLEKFDELKEDGSYTKGPGITHLGKTTNFQLMNGTGGNLVDLGFMYFANMFPPPYGEDCHPQLKFKRPQNQNKSVIFTTGAVSPSRTVPGSYWNPIIRHVKERGFTPVFLGTTRISELKVRFPDGCDYHEGVDLINQTTMMEAAEIMNNAACVIGLDNGLIHLAACTNAAIVCAYNMVSPEHRKPRNHPYPFRPIFLGTKDLSCTGCQSQPEWKMMTPHNFRDCLYQDLKCIDLLFANDGKLFTDAFDKTHA